MMNDALT